MVLSPTTLFANLSLVFRSRKLVNHWRDSSFDGWRMNRNRPKSSCKRWNSWTFRKSVSCWDVVGTCFLYAIVGMYSTYSEETVEHRQDFFLHFKRPDEERAFSIFLYNFFSKASVVKLARTRFFVTLSHLFRNSMLCLRNFSARIPVVKFVCFSHNVT